MAPAALALRAYLEGPSMGTLFLSPGSVSYNLSSMDSGNDAPICRGLFRLPAASFLVSDADEEVGAIPQSACSVFKLRTFDAVDLPAVHDSGF